MLYYVRGVISCDRWSSPSLPRVRYTFGYNYIKSGDDVFRLQRIMGHASLEMMMRYVNL